MELREYLNVIKSKWWVLALLIIIGCTSAFLYSTYYAKPIYEATTDLIVNKTVETTTGQQQIDQNSINTNLMLINTYKQIIKSSAVMKSVVEKNPSFNLTADELGKKVTINSTKDTQVITITVQDTSYQKAALIVSALSDTFIERVASIMKLNNISVLNVADPSAVATRVNDNHMVLMVFSFVVALLIGLGIIFLLNYLDDTIKTEHDVEHILGLPLLAQISTIKKEDMKNMKSRSLEHKEQAAWLHPVEEQR